MSKEYIEKEAFVAEIKERQEEVRRWGMIASCQENRIRADAAMCVFAEIKQTLLAIPAADVKPVVRGEWITDGDVHKCSACGLTTCDDEYGDDPTEEYHFCPNCGAEMREEGKDEVD